MTPPWRKRTVSSGGFTLLEVMVALLLLVIICGALYGTFFAIVKGRDAAVAKMDKRRELSTTLDRIRRELSSVDFPQNADKKLHFVVEDRDYFGKPASTLDFTAITAPRESGIPASDQRRIVYSIEEKEKKLVLVRREKDLLVTSDPIPYPQMGEVAGFLVECYDGDKWVKTWDTALNHRLPMTIRVTISMKDGEKTVSYSDIAAPRIDS